LKKTADKAKIMRGFRKEQKIIANLGGKLELVFIGFFAAPNLNSSEMHSPILGPIKADSLRMTDACAASGLIKITYKGGANKNTVKKSEPE